MPTSGNYDAIKPCIDPPGTKITFTVTGYKADGKARTLCPHVLGYKRHGTPNEVPANERLLCYQIAGPNPNPHWRLYTVVDLVNITAAPMIPWQMGPDYSKHHSIPNDKYHVPYPP
jgi:hypothetical protein